MHLVEDLSYRVANASLRFRAILDYRY